MPPEQVECEAQAKRPRAACDGRGHGTEGVTSMQDVPYGFCHCGCGGEAPTATKTDSRYGWVQGEPKRFIHNHHCIRSGIHDPRFSERFWSHVERGEPDECWPWTASRDGCGYGRLGGQTSVTTKAHRVAYALLVGPIPDGLQIDHLCRNRACCNPAHLEPVTFAENIRRAAVLRTHCKNGHEYPPDSKPGVSRKRCQICRSETQRRRYGK